MSRSGQVFRWSGLAALLCPVLIASVGPGIALDKVDLSVKGGDETLTDALRAASLVVQSESDKKTDSQSVFAAARADYARLIGALYSEGYYSGVVHIEIDGREVADIAPLDAPTKIGKVTISVDPGPIFTFAQARMRPYAPGTKLPPEYADTKVAKSGAIVDAADAGVTGWEAIGYPKADVAGQSIIADHGRNTLSSEIALAPGPKARFGHMTIEGNERMSTRRVAKIAGFPTGELYDPEKVNKIGDRLRQTGIFRSAALIEADKVNSDGTLDYTLTVAEEKLRRFGFGAEASTSDGFDLNAYWMHRNLFGGGENLRVDGALSQISGQGSDLGYDFGVRLERPATPVTDASAFVEARTARIDVLDQTVTGYELTAGLNRTFGDHLTVSAAISYSNQTARDQYGSIDYNRLAFPVTAIYDDRDNPLDATAGYYLAGGVTPFIGFGSTGSGGQITADARTYRAFGNDDRFVLAGRVQLGTIVGSALDDTPPDLLFWSGGGGTVRGQPYQSLGVTLARSPTQSIRTGGMSFAGFSGELRANVTQNIGAVAFYDAGYLTDDNLFGGDSQWQGGAGLGLRYNTGIGPIRFDVALPAGGDTGSGPQIYVGIGQAF